MSKVQKGIACSILLAVGLFGVWTRVGAEYQFANGEFPKVASFEHYREAITHELWLRLLTLPSSRPDCFSTEVTICSYADHYAAWQRWSPQSDNDYYGLLTLYLLIAMGGSIILMKNRNLMRHA